jgi:hypothetical protein
MKSNFVIFAQPRSGSTVFCQNLNDQKDIICMKEIFGQNWPLGIDNKEELQKFFAGINLNILTSMKYKNFEEFLKLMSEASNKPVFGYKIMPEQAGYKISGLSGRYLSKEAEQASFFKNKEIYLNYLKNNKSKIILLTRDNLLLKYISHQTARKIEGFSGSIKSSKYNIIHQLNPIIINYNRYKQYENKQNFELQERKKDVLLYKLPHIHIKYEDLFGKRYLESMAKVYQLLNLDFKAFKDLREPNGIVSGFKKINVYSIKDKIINYEEFKKTAEDNNDIETLKFLQ